VIRSRDQRIVFAALYFIVLLVDFLDIQRSYTDRDNPKAKVIEVEGEPPRSRIVISVFDSMAKAQAWRQSPEVREREANSCQFIVEGLPG
jgi:Domain of unknown function (DUF1330)